MDLENAQSQMRKGILEFCILQILSNESKYSSDILAELKEAQLIVVEGTLYPLLTRLKNTGLLQYKWEESKSGPPRKYYELTVQGQLMLKELKKTWEGLDFAVKSILSNHQNPQNKSHE